MENYIYKMWKNTLCKTGGIKILLATALSTATLSMSLTSCVADNEENTKSFANITNNDIKSYGDLFETFWSVMNQRYCAFNEQNEVASISWDEVYDIYKPKFDALKSFQPTQDFTQDEILADNTKAKQYFKEIVDKIFDQHFILEVTLPVSHSSYEKTEFRSALHQKETYLPLKSHFDHIEDQLESYFTFNNDKNDFAIIGGFMEENPGIYYLGFNEFELSKYCYYKYQKEYLPTDEKNIYHLGKKEIDSNAERLVANPENLDNIKRQANIVLDKINEYLESDKVKAVCSKMTAYSYQGDYHGLYNCAIAASYGIPKPLEKAFSHETKQFAAEMGDNMYEALKDNLVIKAEGNFHKWFSQALVNYLWNEREFYIYWNDWACTYNLNCIEDYRRYFLEPLEKGDIKKLIIDLRSNGGGNATDTRLLTDYLVTHTATYSYMRLKEDNNPYSYTPWIPQQIQYTKRSINRDIPIVILLDYHSASMSEITTLILKSQGDHVKTVGRNSIGGQCMLTGNDSSNGGWQGNVSRYLSFKIPVCQTKDAQGNILESKGITPDYILDPMTEEEIQSLENNQPGAIDRGLQKALEILK